MTGPADSTTKQGPAVSAGTSPIKPIHLLLPLALAQFINAYDTTAMNVAVSKVVANLHTTVSGVNRAFSNLGGSFGTAIAGAVLMSVLISTMWGLVSTNQAIKKVVTPKQLQG